MPLKNTDSAAKGTLMCHKNPRQKQYSQWMTHRTPAEHTHTPSASSLTYELKDGMLSMEYQVENRDQRAMWYAIGAHPGFNCPMEDGFAFEDYQLVFERRKKLSASPMIWTSCTFPLQTGNQAEGLYPFPEP